ncbi:MAG: hypothetical protein OXG51_12810 [Gammaproteobacteria bacterium]|nr:hypothetical protein [Gammaproteobacteria bacterium]
MSIKISDYDSFVEWIDLSVEDPERAAAEEVEFVDWPRYELVVRGTAMDGGVPIRLMPVFEELQRTIHRMYARHEFDNERRPLNLTKKQRLEIVLWPQRGESSHFWILLADTLNNLIEDMTGSQKTFSVAFLVTMIGLGWGLRKYLQFLSEERASLTQVQLSEQETRRLEMFSDLANQNGQLRKDIEGLRKDLDATHDLLMRRLGADEVIVIDGHEVIDGATARRLLRIRRSGMKTDKRVEGMFLITRLDSGSQKRGFRARVQKVDTNEALIVHIPTGIPEGQKRRLQAAEWNKRPIRMQLDLNLRGDQIERADLVRVLDGPIDLSGT